MYTSNVYISKGVLPMAVAEKRTQIYFPRDLYRKIEGIARARSKSVAAIIREAVEQYLNTEEPDWENDPFFNLVGLTETGKGDLAEDHDKYLYRKRHKK